ncbi:MAG: trans-sulfuration enzyme family protein, partial [Candidatus Eiseniibacteriota bacterium]
MTRESKPRPARGVRTRAVHGVDPIAHGPSSTPIVHSATFSFPSLAAMDAEQERGAAGAYYQRVGHPTLHAAEQRLAGLEGAEAALLFSSGVAALAAMFLAHLRSGEHIIALHQCYGGTHDLVHWGADRFGWGVDLADARDPAGWERLFRRETRILHIESPTNPTLCVVDIERAATLAHAHGALLTVDNTFASPIGQKPLALGADLVMYSATKSIGGHSDLLAGAVVGAAAALAPVWKARKVFGPVPDPALAWQVERSLKTLPLRVAAANANALELAKRLAGHPGVAQVLY